MKSLLKDKKIILGILAFLIIILIIGGIVLINKGNKNSKSNDITKNYVAFIKINPSIKLEYTQTCKELDKKDTFDCSEPTVTKYELINDDAKKIYNDIDLLGSSKDLIEVVNVICNTAKNNGIVFEKIDIYTDWDKFEKYVSEKKEVSDIIKYNIEITNKEEINDKINVDESNIQTYTVSFDSNGGNTITSQIIKKDEQVIKPENPKKDGYKFIEWQLDSNVFDFNTKINKDITLKAKWEQVEKNNNSNSNNTSNNSNNVTNNSNNNSNNNSDNNQSSNNSNTQPSVTTPIEEDTHKGVINLNDNVTYITGDIVYKCDNCISDSLIQKIRSTKGIYDNGLDSNNAWLRSINITTEKYSSYAGINMSIVENWLIECGAELVGGASNWDPQLLNEQVCRDYKLSCDRW